MYFSIKTTDNHKKQCCHRIFEHKSSQCLNNFNVVMPRAILNFEIRAKRICTKLNPFWTRNNVDWPCYHRLSETARPYSNSQIMASDWQLRPFYLICVKTTKSVKVTVMFHGEKTIIRFHRKPLVLIVIGSIWRAQFLRELMINNFNFVYSVYC